MQRLLSASFREKKVRQYYSSSDDETGPTKYSNGAHKTHKPASSQSKAQQDPVDASRGIRPNSDKNLGVNHAVNVSTLADALLGRVHFEEKSRRKDKSEITKDKQKSTLRGTAKHDKFPASSFTTHSPSISQDDKSPSGPTSRVSPPGHYDLKYRKVISDESDSNSDGDAAGSSNARPIRQAHPFTSERPPPDAIQSPVTSFSTRSPPPKRASPPATSLPAHHAATDKAQPPSGHRSHPHAASGPTPPPHSDWRSAAPLTAPPFNLNDNGARHGPSPGSNGAVRQPSPPGPSVPPLPAAPPTSLATPSPAEPHSAGTGLGSGRARSLRLLFSDSESSDDAAGAAGAGDPSRTQPRRLLHTPPPAPGQPRASSPSPSARAAAPAAGSAARIASPPPARARVEQQPPPPATAGPARPSAGTSPRPPAAPPRPPERPSPRDPDGRAGAVLAGRPYPDPGSAAIVAQWLGGTGGTQPEGSAAAGPSGLASTAPSGSSQARPATAPALPWRECRRE